jgi:hypothetical protein
LISSNAQAYDLFLDALYWRATETVDWVLINDRASPNQTLSYRTMKFDFAPGFRVGAGYNGEWDSKFYYTYFYNKSNDSTAGFLTSTDIGGKLAQNAPGAKFFFNTGQASLKIDFNMFDWDLGKSFFVGQDILVRPVLGLKAGWINQTYITTFQGVKSINEKIKNNFKGIGPKVGVEGKYTAFDKDAYKFSIFADFSSAYMWGKWKINDVLTQSTPETLVVKIGSRNFGAFVVQAMLGVGLDYKHFAIKLGYEISDWFNQYQVFDDGTGAHNNDLILQGVTLRLSYCF